MTIPWDWLLCQITVADVEADLAQLGVPDLWFRRWRVILDRLTPRDELWTYGTMEYAATAEESTDKLAGFEQVLDGETLGRIGLSEPTDRIVGFRSGIAVVRGDEILDWIEAPPWIP